MATPNENVQILRTYWKAASAVRFSGNDQTDLPKALALVRPLADAMGAMKELVAVAGNNAHTRVEVFAAGSVFEQALVGESPAVTARMFAMVRGGVAWAIMAAADGAMRSPRQIMLDGIWNAGTGGLFSPRDPSGVTSWLRSASVAAGAINGTIAGDPDPNVVAAALRIFRDLALPAIWLESALGFRTFEQLDSRLATTVWSSGKTADLGARMTLKALSASAAGRVQRDLALFAGALGSLPSFPTGDGSRAPTVPPKRKPWYKQGELLAAGAVGLIGGAAARARLR